MKSKHFHIGRGMHIDKMAVARVSCIVRLSAAGEAVTGFFVCSQVSRIFSAEIAIKHEKNRVSEYPQIRAPVETLARGLKICAIEGFTRHAGRCAAADPEGFAHSAAAEGRRERRNGSAAVKAGNGRVGGRMEMQLWLEYRACLCADVPQTRATAASPRPTRGGLWEISLWLESGAHLRPHML